MKYIKKICQGVVGFIIEMYKVIVYILKATVSYARGYRATKPVKLGKKIAILGNGPSNSVFWDNYDKFKGYDVLCVNFFPLESEEIFFTKKPRYLALIDPAFWGDCEGKLKEQVDQLWKVIMRVDWTLYIITSDRNSKPIKSNIKIVNLTSNAYGGGFVQLRHFLYRCNRALPPNSNVVIFSIFFSLTFGFEKIAIWGHEYDTFATLKVENDGDTSVLYQHYYDAPVRVPLTKHGTLWMEFEHAAKSFRSHSLLRKYADKLNRKIINFSINTHVDTYPVLKLSDFQNEE